MTFDALRNKTDALLRTEATSIARGNQKLSARGQLVSQEREDSAHFSSWMDRFVSRSETKGRLVLRYRRSNLVV